MPTRTCGFILAAISAFTCLTAHAEVRMQESSEGEIIITNLPEASETSPAFPSRAAVSSWPDLPFDEVIAHAASRHELDPALLHAVIAIESGYNPRAISPRGAQGLMQLMPDTGRQFDLKNPYEPAANIEAGARYLRELNDRFHGDLALTLAAYNAGPGAVMRHGMRMPPYPETQRYVPAVIGIYKDLSARKRGKIKRG